MLKRSLALLQRRRELYQAKLVFYLFLASLGMFFSAGIVSYWIIRLQAFQPARRDGQEPVAIAYLALDLPNSFWTSTALLVLVSFFLQRGVWLVRRERQHEFRNWLILAWIAALAFVVVQYQGLSHLMIVHQSVNDGSSKAYGMCYAMSLLHALHIVGGIAFLGFVIWRGYQNCYDHERHYAVEHCASYWHFLLGVWALMLATFLIVK